jgi:hypothetical protein
MFPHQMDQLASQHTDELRTQAQRTRLHVMRPVPRNSVRHRAGWTLVEIGLRLVGPSDHA